MMKNNKHILGLGTDIIEIDRMRQSIERHGVHFLNRLFSQKEQDYCYKYKDPVPHFAGRFAAKEAIAKALGTGFGAQIAWHDIEILNNDAGQPIVLIAEALRIRFDSPRLLVSISHCISHATATAIWATS
jgi:holo-[acyl-carrier protein] synthase